MGRTRGSAVHASAPVTAIDPRRARSPSTADAEVEYDALVLATGSSAFVPAGHRRRPARRVRLPHDRRRRRRCEAWVAAPRGRPGPRGAVVGGGLLGLEAAGALHGAGRRHHGRRVRRPADAAAGRRGRRRGAAPDHRGPGRRPCALGRRHRIALPAADGSVTAMDFADGDRARRRRRGLRHRRPARATSWPARPGSRSASAAGVVVDDALPHGATRTSTRSARSPASTGRTWGLVGPGNAMAEVVVDRLLGGDGDASPAPTPRTKLKLLGVDVAQLRRRVRRDAGRARGRLRRPGGRRLQEARALRRRPTLLGGVLVGDASPTPSLRPLLGAELRRGPDRLAAARGRRRAAAPASCPTTATRLLVQQRHRRARSAARVTDARAAPTSARSRPARRPAPAAAPACRWSRSSSTPSSRRRRRGQHGAVRALRAQPGRSCSTSSGSPACAPSARSSPRTAPGRGCDICKPVVASILSLAGRRRTCWTGARRGCRTPTTT